MQNLADAVIFHTGIKPFGGQGLPALSAPARAKLENENAYRVIETALLGADRMTRYEKAP
jgi:diaminohydroxyphosphoribosylaminopyrimidine deaminase/5-amino-6-(5-phosphoribosylamino)uracil reductase